MKIINLTQHMATPEQVVAGVIEPKPNDKNLIRTTLTFNAIPEIEDILAAAKALSIIAKKYGINTAMIGGAPWLMSALERALLHEGIEPVYAFSLRRSVETKGEDGTVVKKTIFKHLGFVRFSGGEK